ncbi:MAG: CvpA family protein [Chloroflexi bacterium]|nr:CvpA family protein [Chloroflexota bacterium]
MNWLDFLIIAIILSCLVGGFGKGLIVSLFGFAGFALGLKLSGEHYQLVAGRLTFIPNASVASAMGFVTMWAAAMVLAGILGLLFRKIVSLVGLGWLDRLGGLAFGLALGTFASVLLLAVMLNVRVMDFTRAIQESKIALFLIERLGFLFQLLPGDWGEIPLIPPVMPGIPA